MMAAYSISASRVQGCGSPLDSIFFLSRDVLLLEMIRSEVRHVRAIGLLIILVGEDDLVTNGTDHSTLHESMGHVSHALKCRSP
jgi:hypothetical protein